VTVVATALSATGIWIYANHATSASDRAPVGTVLTVRRGTVAVTQAASGTVQAAKSRGLSFGTSGTVTEVSVKAGDRVTAGEVLARIDDSDAKVAVSTAQADVAAAQDAVNSAEQTASSGGATCQAAGATYRVQVSASPQSSVPAGSGSPTTASPSPTPSGSPAATGLPSAGPGGPTGSPPGGGQPSNGTGGRRGGSGGGSGGCGSGGAAGGTGSGSGGDSLLSAQEQLNNANQELALANQKLAGTVTTAPLDGKVTSITGSVGVDETPGATAFITLAAIDVEVQAQFSEADVAALAVGQSASISLANRTGTFPGKVSHIDPAGTTSGQLVRYAVMIAFDQPPQDLLYGQAASTVVTTASAANVLYVTSSMITQVVGDTGVVTVRVNGRDEFRTVHIGLRGDQYTEIRTGLAQGDQVVLTGGG
jgi:HlyD family secretion protein